jgi:hypothetical protein
MALVVKDRVRETSTTAGTGALTLAGAVTGFQSFSVIGDGNTTYYTIVDAGTGAWEVGIGTYTSSTTSLSRDTVLESSNSGNLVNFGSNLKDVFVTYPAERSIYTDAAGTAITPATASVLGVASGGTGQSTYTDGQLLIGNSTGNTLAKSTLTAGTGISITNGTGSITVAATNNGDVVGPASSTDNAVARFDLTTGKIIQNSGVIVDDSNNVSGVVGQTMSGNLTFTGTGNRITGDTNNATISSRLFFQSSTTNGSSSFATLPNGTSLVSGFQAYNNSDPTNAAFAQLATSAGTEVRITSGIAGTGTYLPMTFFTGGSERMRIDTSGNVGIGTSSPVSTLDVVSDAAAFSLTSRGRSVDEIGIIRFMNNAGSTEYARLDSRPGDFRIQTTANNPILFLTNGANERMRIDSSGNVGIGLSSPATKLDVDGQISGKYTDVGTNTAAQDLAANHVSQVTISANTTLTTTVPPAGTQAIVVIVTSGATSRTVTFGSGFASTGTLATGTTADRRFVVSFVSDGTRLIECSRTVAIAV